MTAITIGVNLRPLLGSIVGQGVIAEATQLGRWCKINASGQLILAAADDAATSTGMLVLPVAASNQKVDGTVAVGDTVTFVSFGRVAIPGAEMDPTDDFYLSDTPGVMADAAGTVTRRLGRSEASEVFFVNPDISEATSS